tara:strand:- start:437 stop:2116 length:1680 start_codon:yes stop_codon:yes gene_type:complete
MVLARVLGPLRQYAPKVAAPKGKGSAKKLDLSAKPFSVFDEAGLPIKDFKTFDDAMKFAKDQPSYTVGNTPKAGAVDAGKNAPALFYKSREALIDAPMEKMSADRWLNYLNAKGIKKSELLDTSLGPFLQSQGTKTFTKADIIKEFDEISPKLDVLALGQPGSRGILANMVKKLQKVDPKAEDPRVGGFLSYLRDSLPGIIREEKINQQALDKVAANVDQYMQQVFGVKSALNEGVALTSPIPFKVREPLINLAAALDRRGVGLKPEDVARKPSYAGQQTLPGGDNYREFLFKYEPGKLRTGEPIYTYAHDFGLTSSQRAGGIVHARVSDRTDEFGRRLMFVEEIQSDMHQRVQRAMREAKITGKKPSREDSYAYRQDMPPPPELAANKQQLDLINLKIENLLATNPRSPALPKLRQEREKIRVIIAESMTKEGKQGGDVAMGPFQTSKEYMEFVAKYLVRVAKDGDYDGVAFSTPAIKNRNLSPGGRDYQGNVAAYGPILNGALKETSKKTGANLLNTVIKDDQGRVFGQVKMLNLKDNKNVGSSFSAYAKGGIVNGR